ncbi:acyltransferase family protein [Paenibacillus aestuarii]|uniref:Acyltransferase family protein n=1 Tax=Paenibacillus aestuarii TaxID=516965 RepID=A0ABW0K0C4_9BACL|nr:acyltransferase [Paenibacillus aestuarii]
MNMNQRIAIQASRGIAACLVLLFHSSAMSFKYYQYDFLGISSIGRSGGVDFFFMLTGFLLYHAYGKRIGTRISITPYLTKRLIRIYPFYWLITLIVLPVYFLVPSFGYGYETNHSTIVHSLLLLPQEHGPILPVAWSLSYFVFFYLLFGLMLAIGKRPAYVFASLWLALTFCHVLHVPIIAADMDHNVYLNFLFNEANLEFAIGCLLAKWSEQFKFRHYQLLMGLGAAGFALIWLNNKYNMLPYHDYLLYVIPSILVLLGAASIKGNMHLGVWVKALSKIGDASYSILLTHLLFISIMMKLARSSHLAENLGYLPTDILIVALTIPLCRLAYVWAEKPLVAFCQSKITLKPSASPKPSS